MQYQIREFEDSDIPAAAQLLKSMWMEHVSKHPKLLDHDYIDKVDVKKYLQKYLNTDGSSGYVAVADNRIVGLATVETHKFNDMHNFKKLAYFDNLVVHKSYRRHGIADALIETRETWARKHKIKVSQSKIYSHNEPAQRLLEKHGFDKIYYHYYKFFED